MQPDYGQAVEGAVTSIRPPYDVRKEDQIGRHLVIMTKPNAVPTRARPGPKGNTAIGYALA